MEKAITTTAMTMKKKTITTTLTTSTTNINAYKMDRKNFFQHFGGKY